MADWIEDYYDGGEPFIATFIREKRREIAFLDSVQVAAPRYEELSPSVTHPADPCGRPPASSSSGQDTGLSRRRHGFNPRRGHRGQRRG